MKTEGAIVDAIDEIFGEPNELVKQKALQNISLLYLSIESIFTPNITNLRPSTETDVESRCTVLTVNSDTYDGWFS